MDRSTVIMVVLALAGLGGAYNMRPQELPPVQFEDTGEALFPEFTDPTTATSLEVVAWDEDEAQVVTFKVMQKEGRWVIPSHNDYPADGTERMGKAAASFIDVKKDRYYGDNPADFAAFGVLDPEGDEGKGDEKGQRITIKDASDTTLVDIIVGKEIPDRPGYYYVRMPGEENKRVYGSKLELDISTKFEDWIEKDLLEVDRDDFYQMTYDPYVVDEVEGKVTGFNPVIAEVASRGNRQDWKVVEGTEVPEGKQLDSMKVRQILTALSSLKIVGVRPRPPARNILEQQILAQDMKRKGFFVVPTEDGRAQLFGNEGMLSAVTDDGIVYSLLFGEVTYESGIALTAGVADSSEGDKGVMEEGLEEEPAEEGDTSKKASRFMFVDVFYDPSLDTTLAGMSAPEAPPSEGAEGETGGEGAAEPAGGSSEPIDPEGDAEKMKAGKEKAAKLRQRFDQWFYVISDSSFTQMHKARDEMFKDAPAAPTAPGTGDDAPIE
ncbi:MAG: DUF4340 domain-containing protein [Myxococcales bacterium]|nr:DUF4340 domain-containing protein [Myxococcales bacterium]MCB9712665.1 DUF4340 domain-containing protein [Myxococcales bacterium]